MVRPNQIIASNINEGELTFLMFAQTEEQVKRRVLLINFPSLGLRAIQTPNDFIKNVQIVTSGMINRYAVTVNINEI